MDAPCFVSLFGDNRIDRNQGGGVSVTEVRSSIRALYANSAVAIRTEDFLKKGGGY
jgi:hypothetical protein